MTGRFYSTMLFQIRCCKNYFYFYCMLCSSNSSIFSWAFAHGPQYGLQTFIIVLIAAGFPMSIPKPSADSVNAFYFFNKVSNISPLNFIRRYSCFVFLASCKRRINGLPAYHNKTGKRYSKTNFIQKGIESIKGAANKLFAKILIPPSSNKARTARQSTHHCFATCHW